MIKLKDIYEDAVMGADAGSAVGGEIASPSNTGDADIVTDKGTSNSDVLGKDCHKNGFLGVGCFHAPMHCKKLSTDGSKRKKKKTPYEKGMVIIEDERMKQVNDEFFYNMLIKDCGIDAENLYDLKAVIKVTDDVYFLKFLATLNMANKPNTYFVELIPDGSSVQLSKANRKPINAKTAKKKFLELNSTGKGEIVWVSDEK